MRVIYTPLVAMSSIIINNYLYLFFLFCLFLVFPIITMTIYQVFLDKYSFLLFPPLIEYELLCIPRHPAPWRQKTAHATEHDGANASRCPAYDCWHGKKAASVCRGSLQNFPRWFQVFGVRTFLSEAFGSSAGACPAFSALGLRGFPADAFAESAAAFSCGPGPATGFACVPF